MIPAAARKPTAAFLHRFVDLVVAPAMEATTTAIGTTTHRVARVDPPPPGPMRINVHRAVDAAVAVPLAASAHQAVASEQPPEIEQAATRSTVAVEPAPRGAVHRVVGVDVSQGPEEGLSVRRALKVAPPAPIPFNVHRAVDVGSVAASEVAARRTVGVTPPLKFGAKTAVRRTQAIDAPTFAKPVATRRTIQVQPTSTLSGIHRAIEIAAPELRVERVAETLASSRVVDVDAPPLAAFAPPHRTVQVDAPAELIARLHRAVSVLAPFPVTPEPRARSYSHVVLRKLKDVRAELPPLSGFDVDGRPLKDFIILQQPRQGDLELDADGVPTYTRHDPTWTGHDSFTYVVQNAQGERSEPATVRLHVKSAAQMVVRRNGRAIIHRRTGGKRCKLVVADRVRMLPVAAAA